MAPISDIVKMQAEGGAGSRDGARVTELKHMNLGNVMLLFAHFQSRIKYFFCNGIKMKLNF